jgi:oligopeptidase B
VLGERSDGLQRLEVLDSATGALHLVEQPDTAYTAFPGSDPNYEASVMRFFYTSLTAPFSAVDYDMSARRRTVVKEQPVPGYDRDDYVTERLWTAAPDGARVPMSIVYKRGLRRDGSSPALLNGYGAYELSSDPMFDPVRLSLLDRGFVFAIAHVRGGGEMGRGWYEDGKFLHKTNTFSDFIACAERLVELGYTSPHRLAIRGRSAGGLLIGAVINMRPDLFACAVAQVPFVDALTTMLDDKLPLNDPRVSYWEPAKWVAKLRSLNRGDNVLLLKTQMGSGHSGPSGRYESWREEAFIAAFVLDQVAS